MAAPVSVVIPCYCCGNSIQRAVESVVNQTLPPREIILVNDHSPDQTLAYLRDLEAQYSADFIRVIDLEENVGPGAARNRGWESAAQDYIAFLDADDAWHPQKLEIQYGWMAKNPEVKFSAHQRVYQPRPVEAQRLSIPPEQKTPAPVTKYKLFLSNYLPTSSWLFFKSALKPFSSDYYCEDYRLLINNLLEGRQLYFFDLPLAYCFRQNFSRGGLSGRLWKMEKAHLAIIQDLRQDQKISNLEYSLLIFYALAKFPRRILYNSLRNLQP